jgi:hypothetical protein
MGVILVLAQFLALQIFLYFTLTESIISILTSATAAPHPRLQLLRMGWFPASTNHPRTVFTFDLLKLFHKITLQGKTTLYDFYHAILQVDDGLQLGKVTRQ